MTIKLEEPNDSSVSLIRHMFGTIVSYRDEKGKCLFTRTTVPLHAYKLTLLENMQNLANVMHAIILLYSDDRFCDSELRGFIKEEMLCFDNFLQYVEMCKYLHSRRILIIENDSLFISSNFLICISECMHFVGTVLQKLDTSFTGIQEKFNSYTESGSHDCIDVQATIEKFLHKSSQKNQTAEEKSTYLRPRSSYVTKESGTYTMLDVSFAKIEDTEYVNPGYNLASVERKLLAIIK